MVEGIAGGSLSRSILGLISGPGGIGELYEVLGEFFHALRNRLHCLNLTLYVARKNGLLSAEEGLHIETLYRRIEDLLGQLQWICRPAESQLLRLDLWLLLEERRASWSEKLAARDGRLVLTRDRDAAEGWFDPYRLSNALDALTAWRAGAMPTGSLVEVSARVDRGAFHLEWIESEGVAALPGTELAEDHSSLALAIAGRAMADHGGDLIVSDGPGFVLTLRWPVGSGADQAGWSARPAGRSPLTGPMQHA